MLAEGTGRTGRTGHQRGKLVDLATAAGRIPDGAVVAFGGSLLHRTPAAFARELARQARRGLTFVKPSAAYDLDLLCAAGCLAGVEAGIVTFEPPFGLAPHYRAAVERGHVRLREHA